VAGGRRTIPLAGLVIVAAFLLGYFLPDLLGGSPAGEQVAASAPAFPSNSTPALAPTAQATSPVVPQPTATQPRLSAPPATPTASSSPSPAARPAEASATPAPTGSPPAPTSTPAPRTHVVEPGDNLWDLAQRYGVSVDAIVSANGLSDPEALVLGQKLVIPPPEPQR